MIRSFEEANRSIMNISSMDEKLQFVLDDIYNQNVNDEKCPHLNLFIGELFFNSKEDSYYFIQNVQTIFGHEVHQNPYYPHHDYKGLHTFLILMNYRNKDELTDEEVFLGGKVVFSCRLGPFESYKNILTTQRVKTFIKLGITDDDNIIHRIVSDKNFCSSDYADKIIKYNWPYEFKEFLERSKTISNTTHEEDVERKNLEEFSKKAKKISKFVEEKTDELIRLNAKLKEEQATLQEVKQNQQIAEQRLQWLKQSLSDFIGPIKNDTITKSVPIQATAEEMLKLFRERLDYTYSEDLILPFLMALGTDQIITLFGKPGTGKTTFVIKAAKALGARCTIVEIQNNWTERSDLLGYYNPIDRTFIASPFTNALLAAKEDFDTLGIQSRLHIICLDEMNLARVEYYFAEFLSKLQLEYNRRYIQLLPDVIQRSVQKVINKKYDDFQNKNSDLFQNLEKEDQLYELIRYLNFRLPPNIRFIGTINHDDTTNSLSPKVIDRSFFLEVTKESHSQEKKLNEPADYFPLSFFDVDMNNNGVFTPQELSKFDKEAYESENVRFKKYAGQMWTMYNKIKHEGTEKEFFELVIISKVLPAIHKSDEYKYSGFEKANRLFGERQDDTTDYYNFLRG